ncbi:MAG: hypothetical protein OZSIB_2824 [Candidatus Ozemobacter sibiricus]|uniref:Bacterial membrane protein YfhO n=1 Tax=Candidatus Ozemobacter sibiricus TaxID=2268124 RepID=A0A367ZSC8_9BACT|nr:MAG: hypothetical protein OZSIB_2824 [Candidatus Ozemobacter sibiricus]
MSSQPEIGFPPSCSGTRPPLFGARTALLLLAVVVIIQFGALLWSNDRVVSRATGDFRLQYLGWRTFVGQELAAGRFPFWNPYQFGGIPFFSDPQKAVLYPFTWLYAVCSVGWATNIIIAVHVYLGGAFMILWALSRGLSPPASFMAGLLFMGSGPFFSHIYPGHLSNLCSMPWIPLVFLIIDRWLTTDCRFWCLAGAVAVALQILGGHLQYVYYTALMGLFYVLYSLPWLDQPVRKIFWVLLMFMAAASLAAVQLFPAAAFFEESFRPTQPELAASFAANCSFHPSAFLTMVMPWFFGPVHGPEGQYEQMYLGKWLWWEENAFMGILGWLAAAMGLVLLPARVRLPLALTALTASLLALGSHSPLFALLGKLLWGYHKFRGHAKLMLFVTLCLALLAGYAIELFLRGLRPSGAALGLGLMLLVVLALMGMTFFLQSGDPACSPTLHARFLQLLYKEVESQFEQKYLYDSWLMTRAARTSGWQCLRVAGVLGMALLLLWLIPAWQPARWLCLGVVALDILAFMWVITSVVTDLTLIEEPGLREFLARQPGEPRTIDFATALLEERGEMVFAGVYSNDAMRRRIPDVWGYDFPSSRYVEFMNTIQGLAFPHPTDRLAAVQHPLFRLLRLRYLLVKPSGQPIKVQELSWPLLPRAFLVGQVQVASDSDQALLRILDPAFDPRVMAVVEQTPRPPLRSLPDCGDPEGRVTVIGSGTNHLDLDIDTPTAAFLVITDAYAPGWRVEPLHPPPQEAYYVQPANCILQGMALVPGHHRIRLRYRPPGWESGLVVSLVTASFLLGLGWLWSSAGEGRNWHESGIRGDLEDPLDELLRRELSLLPKG